MHLTWVSLFKGSSLFKFYILGDIFSKSHSKVLPWFILYCSVLVCSTGQAATWLYKLFAFSMMLYWKSHGLEKVIYYSFHFYLKALCCNVNTLSKYDSDFLELFFLFVSALLVLKHIWLHFIKIPWLRQKFVSKLISKN